MSLSTKYDKMARDFIKKYGQKESFQSQGEKFTRIDIGGTLAYRVELDRPLLIAKMGDIYYVSYEDNTSLLAKTSGKGVDLSDGFYDANLDHFTRALNNRIANNASGGDTVEIFSGSDNLNTEFVIGFYIKLRNYPELDGYRSEKLEFLVNGEVKNSKENTENGLDHEETISWLKGIQDALDTWAPEESKEEFKLAFADFAIKVARVFRNEGRTYESGSVDFVEE